MARRHGRASACRPRGPPQESAGQIDVEDLAEQFDAGIEERHIGADPGRIDQEPRTGPKPSPQPSSAAITLGSLATAHDRRIWWHWAHRLQFAPRGVEPVLREVGNHEASSRRPSRGFGDGKADPEARR